ncbi:RHS repeat-associated core domain-containing protein [Mitsuaria sp. GD03876]|uniref:RHS repeat-associated core domain-containing protein n=1 Tax=Mitsuaria sp. GD03876 TaxID=2975399 RepID=UPI002447F070|nr:RHS repeat-associated core domain-containing protein [Mitsuaria sp. GD03876]MDH0865905.1 DUF637 domain-containing protein [Mitsuaria sp. GD03876]
MSRKDVPMPMNRVLRGVLRAIAATLPAWSVSAALAQSQVTRTVAYEYHPITGQLIKETVEPGSTDCVLTEHQLDAYGNRKLTTTSSCSPSGANFVPRATQYVYAAQNGHGEGAFVTALRVGKPGLDANPALAMSRASNRIDPGTGQPLDKTIEADAGRHLTTRVEYDGFGRVKRQYTPVSRDGSGASVDGYVDTRRVYCLGPMKTAQAGELAACLDIRSLGTIPVDYRSRLNTDGQGNPVATVAPTIVSAYYLETQSYGPSGEAAGPPSRVHYDSLHREVAKEIRHFSGKWVMELTAYDELGLVVAGWNNFYGRDVSGAVTPGNADDHRQWTVAFDLMHRAVHQRGYWRGAENGSRLERDQLTIFRGLESIAEIPAGSTPDQVSRQTIARKDAQGLVVQTVDAYGATLNTAYDAVGNPVRIVDAMSNTTAIAYSPGHARFRVEMSDPSIGTWKYEYDGLGQLRRQIDGKRQPTSLDYDELGRMTAKRNADLNTVWYHDRTSAGQPCASGHNRLCEVASGADPANPALPKVAHYRMSYDSLARLAETALGTGDRTFVSSAAYDGLGRVARQSYPTGFAVSYGYAGPSDPVPGVLVRVADAANAARVFWQIDGLARSDVFNSRGQLLKSRLGNGVESAHNMDPLSGKAFRLFATNGAGDWVLNHRYTYDKVANIVTREEAWRAVMDEFQYDRLNRLTHHQLRSGSDAGATRAVGVTYNALGSILSKEDVGGYRYNAAGASQPFAVKSAGGSDYFYDDNGQLTSVTGVQRRTNTWTAFNRPATMSYGSNKVTFLYDGDYKRLREDFYSAGMLQRRVFQLHPDSAGGLSYEREDVVAGPNARTEHRHYVSIGGEVVAVVKTLGEGAGAGAVQADPKLLNYWHKDALGSIVAVSDANGQVIERALFDPWGRRQASTGAEMALTDGPAHGDRGFTGHEHLDELALVHMNGRLYDPLLGRFISADPLIQDPTLLQGYNRYSYVLNNPLIYRDPTGEWWQIPVFVVGFVLAQEGNQYWRMAGQIMMMAALSGAGKAGGLVESGLGSVSQTFAHGGLGNAVVSAGVATALTPGATVESIAQSMLFAAAFNVVGAETLNKSIPAKMLAHAVVGCLQGAATGGSCGPSALSGVVGKGFSEATSGLDLHWAVEGTMTMVAGGTASVVGGGKFASGAAQAGFAYLFNNLSKHGRSLARLAGKGAQYLSDVLLEAGAEPIHSNLHLRANGVHAIADGVFQFKGADFFHVAEVKLGEGDFTKNQRIVYKALAKGEDIEMWGTGADKLGARLGLKPDAKGVYKVPAGKLQIEVFTFTQQGAPTPSRSKIMNDALKKGVNARGGLD